MFKVLYGPVAAKRAVQQLKTHIEWMPEYTSARICRTDATSQWNRREAMSSELDTDADFGLDLGEDLADLLNEIGADDDEHQPLNNCSGHAAVHAACADPGGGSHPEPPRNSLVAVEFGTEEMFKSSFGIIEAALSATWLQLCISQNPLMHSPCKSTCILCLWLSVVATQVFGKAADELIGASKRRFALESCFSAQFRRS